MKMKIYTIYNERSELQEGLFLARNDKEAQYMFAIRNKKMEQESRYFDESIYKLKCLGVIEMEGENSGILYEYAKDFPYQFDSIPDGILPTKHDQESIENIDVKDEKREKELIKESRRM